MRFDILTLFPAMFDGPFTESILKRAQQAGRIATHVHNIRDWAADKHRTADDAPYGGGAGMVMKVEPLAACIRAVLADIGTGGRGDAGTLLATDGVLQQEAAESAKPPVILLSPDGELFTQALAQELAREPRLVLVCGHYEGIDERVRATLITREISIGDYVLTGGELAAMVVVDAVARLVPGVIDSESIAEESHSDGLLEYPHYTRPAVWEGLAVPDVLTSGHHGEVARWRRRERLRRTLARRPDMLATAYAAGLLTPADLAYLADLGWTPD
jgi:tRNA (guanine37-N1)-methyltransferase